MINRFSPSSAAARDHLVDRRERRRVCTAAVAARQRIGLVDDENSVYICGFRFGIGYRFFVLLLLYRLRWGSRLGRGGSVSGSVSGGGSDTAISSSAASCFESVCIGGGVCEQLSVGTTSAQALTEQSRAAAESSANARRAALINNPLNIRDLSDASALPYVADAFFFILRHLLE